MVAIKVAELKKMDVNMDENDVNVALTSVSSYCIKADTLKAEMVHSQKEVHSHQGFERCENNDYALIFPYSQIAKAIKCGETKTNDLTVFGIDPYTS